MDRENKISYEGEWKDDYFHGEGILKDNGYIYKGGFCKGKKEGKAKVTCEFNDYYYHGLWNDDMKNGYGII